MTFKIKNYDPRSNAVFRAALLLRCKRKSRSPITSICSLVETFSQTSTQVWIGVTELEDNSALNLTIDNELDLSQMELLKHFCAQFSSKIKNEQLEDDR